MQLSILIQTASIRHIPFAVTVAKHVREAICGP